MSKGASYIVPRAGTRKADIDQLAETHKRRMARRSALVVGDPDGTATGLLIADGFRVSADIGNFEISYQQEFRSFAEVSVLNPPKRAMRKGKCASRSKYSPHMGAREIARAARRAGKGGAA